MYSLKTEADVCVTGLIHGLLTRSDVANWADAVIEANDSMEYGIIELSLSASKDSLANIERTLEAILGESDDDLVVKILLGILAKKYRDRSVSIREASIFLYQLLTSDQEFYQSKMNKELLYITDAIDLAIDGTSGDLSDVQKELADFLDQYRPLAQKSSIQF